MNHSNRAVCRIGDEIGQTYFLTTNNFKLTNKTMKTTINVEYTAPEMEVISTIVEAGFTASFNTLSVDDVVENEEVYI